MKARSLGVENSKSSRDFSECHVPIPGSEVKGYDNVNVPGFGETWHSSAPLALLMALF